MFKLLKENLMSLDQQCHHYQQNNYRSSQLIEYKKHGITTYDIGNPGSGLGYVQKM